MFSILVIDDEPDNFDVIEAFLSGEEYRLHYAADGQTGLDALPIFQPDLILLDVMMPGLDGMAVCQHLKATPRWEGVPIIMVTALATKTDLARCLAAGADDFISKPINRTELTARVRSMLRIRQQHQQLAAFNARLEATVKQRTAELVDLIVRDPLTGLPSRTGLIQALEEANQAGESDLALVYLDCDQFKLVNGSFGHGVGDQLLIAIAKRLQQHLHSDDVLARIGEDEFCFLIIQDGLATTLEPFIESVLRSFDAPFKVEGCDIFITISIGIALNKDKAQSPEALLQDADTAMYQAKVRGKGNYQIFDRQMHMAMLNRLTLESDLQRALAQQEFILYYQPIVALETQQLAGVEALVRWQHPERGLIAPDAFVPYMEATGLIVPVGMMVFRQACQQLCDWQQLGWNDRTLNVNLSARQFARPNLLTEIDHILVETGVSPAFLKLEITETALMENAEMAISLANSLRSRQLQITIDDFGTGYSSLNYLHRFPVDSLKIDQSFVSQIYSEDIDYPVIDTIMALANQLGLSIVAEGIETASQLAKLQQLGCGFGQGFLFAEPMTAAEIEQQYLRGPSCVN
ncbi:MAG: EAL domain-containing protein [Leptolyngbyaceae cyanobacterium]